jgi:hypothetical protein
MSFALAQYVACLVAKNSCLNQDDDQIDQPFKVLGIFPTSTQ